MNGVELPVSVYWMIQPMCTKKGWIQQGCHLPCWQQKWLLIEVKTHQHIHHMQVHGDDVGNGADEVLFHAVEYEHSEIWAQAQNYFQKQETCQRNLSTERAWWHLVLHLMLRSLDNAW